jgi:hypothetical protein
LKTINKSVVFDGDYYDVEAETNEKIELEQKLADHDYILDNNTTLTDYSNHVIIFIAGFIVDFLIERMKCETCLECLLAETSVDPAMLATKLKVV